MKWSNRGRGRRGYHHGNLTEAAFTGSDDRTIANAYNALGQLTSTTAKIGGTNHYRCCLIGVFPGWPPPPWRHSAPVHQEFKTSGPSMPRPCR